MCGEKILSINRDNAVLGSPPHVRGKAVLCGFPAGNVGITPACAGKSRMKAPCVLSMQDHPRMCGEKCTVSTFIACGLGSPPHVRGKGHTRHLRTLRHGITPACAGKSAAAQILRHLYWDHPRMCGEKAEKEIHRDRERGSPPHVRGKEEE